MLQGFFHSQINKSEMCKNKVVRHMQEQTTEEKQHETLTSAQPHGWTLIMVKNNNVCVICWH